MTNNDELIPRKKEATLAVGWLYNQMWAIEPAALQTMIQIADRDLSNIQAVMDAKAAHLDPSGDGNSRIKDGIATIDINGPIFARAGFFDKISGATDLEVLSKDFKMAMDNPNVSGIILHIDSPGGEVSGTSEFATQVAEGAKTKKVYAYVQGAAASGAYWIASAASKIYMADSAIVGSIGVVMGYRSEKEKNAKAGVKDIEIVSSVSPDKRLDPESDIGRGKVQKTVDDIASVFVSTVAKNRNVTTDLVAKEFGQGWVKVGQEAVAAGMADGISTHSGVVAMMKSQSKGVFNMSGENKETKTFAQADLDKARAEGKEEGIKAGMASERERIASIEAVEAPGYEHIIAENKFKDGMTAEKVSMAVLSAQKTTREARATAETADAKKLATTTTPAANALPSDGEKTSSAVASGIAAGANASRERREAHFTRK